ncbi:hypothetical protein KFL_004720050 [Klebsormidium nitens]|uniref:mRNA export factor GLE1 n=1 Tax=Klebsormidium nitens TaxID=105231 RepID=A0A0U9HSE6_KLENI|nr:hypothetical protein KFL_004720050 [Klebsormidium nitens]|eukprot:GAQ88946.1 hypothetical protein KFL_004720050 [Klebsormidium nitens]
MMASRLRRSSGEKLRHGSEEKLHLTLRSPSLLARSNGQAGLSSRLEVDPDPDWNLGDLSAELDKIVYKNGATPSPLRGGTARGAEASVKRLSCIELFEPTDFGRTKAPFIVRVPDFDDEDDEGVPSGAPASIGAKGGRTEDLRLPESVPPAEEVAAASGRSWEESLLPPPDVVEAALFELEKERLAGVKEDIRARWRGLARHAEAQGQQEAEALAALEREREKALQRVRARDAEDQRGIAEARDAHLSALQRDHEQREAASQRRLKDSEAAAKAAAEAEARRRRAEEEARRVEERRQQEAAEKAAEEARRKKEQEDEEARRKRQAEEAEAERRRAETDAERKRAERETVAKRGEEERKAKEQAEKQAAKATGGARQVKMTESAARGERERMEVLRRVKENVKAFEEAPGAKKERKGLERRMTTLVQQISATQRQVGLKSAELVRELQQAPQPQQNFLLLALADKFLSQCESQVQKLPSFAFPLAQVAINVAAAVPPFRDVLLARLAQECCFVVPKYIPYIPAQYESEAAYYRTVGYREEDGQLESTDAYIGRMTGIMVFYAAITQTDPPRGQPVHGLDQAWAWLARLLNGLPPNRGSGSALESMIKVAGFRLNQTYPKQFRKILDVIMTALLPALQKTGDADTAPVINRVETYVGTRSYEKPPEGRNMPVTDESATLGAVDTWNGDRRGYG